ncbi:hypothetical protein GBA52_025198 [Prunus armeniaca]|nr:hypothetical protein GBA52_025198 [Prunus armeniaca]
MRSKRQTERFGSLGLRWQRCNHRSGRRKGRELRDWDRKGRKVIQLAKSKDFVRGARDESERDLLRKKKRGMGERKRENERGKWFGAKKLPVLPR